MKQITFSHKLLLLFITLISFQGFSQCFEIETILVDACSATSPSNDEGFNEMVRFRVGATPLNTSTLTVNWPANGWTGLIQNATTASKVALINSAIVAAGNCGLVLEPVAGVLPANSEVLLVTSQNFTVNYNSFSSLTSTLYIIFQNNTATTGGHFGNYNATPGTRTLSMTFGAGCSDSVTYERSNLINIFGLSGGTNAEQDGASVSFTPAGNPTYINNGCTAPVPPFTVAASVSPNSCVAPGSVVNLTGVAQGYQSLAWTSTNGAVPNPNNLNTTYTVPINATGTISFTLSATNSCNVTISSTVTISVGAASPPSVSPITYCQNATASPLTATASSGGTLNWYGTNATGGTASATAPTPSTSGAPGSVVHYYVSQTIGGCESTRADIAVTIGNAPTTAAFVFCDTANSGPNTVAFDFNNIGPTASYSYSYTIDGGTPVTGSIPSINGSHFEVNGVSPGQVVVFTVSWDGICQAPLTASTTVPTFTQVGPICSGQTLSPLPTTSNNGFVGTWSPALNNTATTTYTFIPNAAQCASKTTMTIVVNPNNTVSAASATVSLCVNTPLTAITHTTTGATGIGSAIGLPSGVTASWSSNTITISGTPSVSGIFNYSIPLTGGSCSSVNATGTITVTANNTVGAASATPTVCINTPLTAITHATTGATGIGTATGLPTGVTATWSSNTITISGTPTVSGIFNYTIPLTGGCGTINATGTITVSATNTPTFTAVAPICSGAPLAALPTTSNNGYTGTWSPALNNTATTLYTFTPTTGQCATTATLTITVNSATITPTFTAVTPICSGGTLSPLPTTSNNGITGAWSPALNNTATTTYTFTPNTGQCATTTTLQIVVSSNITPTFTPINPVCSGTALAPLPTTSNNGIIGIWSPALNNTTTTTYTFTPNGGQCATNQTITITILQKVTPTFNAVTPVCFGGAITPLPTTSNNGITGTWSPALDNTTTTTYTFLPNSGECANTTSLQIEVVPQIVPTISVVESCNANTITVTNPLGSDYQYSLDGGVFQSSPFYFNVTSGNHVLIAKQVIANCTSNPLNFTVNAVINDVVISTPAPFQLCDPNNDGVAVFDLTQTINSITGGNPYTVSFHETITDANVDGTAIPNPANYSNIFNWAQTIYVRVESLTTDCFGVVQLQLIVNPTPEAVSPTDYHLCDYTGAVGYEAFDLTTKVPEILGSINPALTSVTFYTSQTAAETATGAISNVINYINGTIDTQTLYVRVETIASGCFDIVTLTLVVDPLPIVPPISYPQYSLCDDNNPGDCKEVFDLGSKVADILNGQTGMSVTFYPSLTDAQNNTNAISTLLYENVLPCVQTLGIRITNQATTCYVISTMDIRVNPLPTPVPPTAPLTVCDDNQNGITCDIDLTSLTPDILQGADYDITYHETQTDAEIGGTTIPNPSSYCNITNFVQIIYVRAEDPITGCYSVIPIELNVNPSPVKPVTIPDLVTCDQDNNPQSGSTIVDLTSKTAAILLLQAPNPASNYTVTYYLSQGLADAGTSPIINAATYFGSDTQVIWVRIEDNATGCYALGSFQLVINKPLLLITPQPLSKCDNDTASNNLYYTFDLTVKNTEINQNTGYTVTYYPSLVDAQNNTNVITTPSAYTNTSAAVQTLGVLVTTTAGCKSITTLDIRVLPVPTPQSNNIPVLAAQCEDAPGSGVAQFDLTLNEAYIANGDTHVDFHYFPSHADLEANTSEILNPTTAIVGDPSIAGTTINQVQYVYVAVTSDVSTDYTGRKCYKEVQQGFIVNPLPSISAIADYQICEADPSGVNDGIEVFDLTTQSAALLQGNQTTPVSAYSVAFYEDAALTIPITTPNAYTNLTNPQTIYVEITNTTTGCKSGMGSFNILVNPKPTINYTMADMKECDYDGNNNGTMLYTQNPTSPLASLAGYEADILGATQTAPTYIVEFYYNSQADAEAGNSGSALTNLDTYEVQTGTYWVRVENTLTGCYELDSFDVVIEKLAEPVITSNTGSNIACVRWNQTTVNNNLILNSGITAPGYTFIWTANNVVQPETTSTLSVNNIALADTHVVYTVQAVSLSPMLGCTSDITALSTFDVIKSGPADNITATVTNAFAENQIITITNDGYGVYEYSLDDGPRQTSPIFENVSLGNHTVYVWDVRDPNGYSCGVEFIKDVQTIDYPHYFTPNGDGYHDTWNISGLHDQPGAKIYIFDRYGKLLKQLSPLSPGWDGTYNGHLLPSDDYWFTVDFAEGSNMRQFKAHFSLKR
ncbi:T9SS type B sorting domain-containing protein [Flavobacterium phycosphaerae]|uniref:T9SS type B sorting domain-containing protein n=1 Tax=Flavobacterium phycosphaerae TaxID=2697515 RepID=UPI00138AFE94|nr:T9SS type B sorting domain-containing protein [Flavobacterium phycosphaerae]